MYAPQGLPAVYFSVLASSVIIMAARAGLLPPYVIPALCTCGYSLANGRIGMFFNALYLFVINSYFIYLSSELVLMILGTPRVKELTEQEWKAKRKKIHRNTVIVLLPIIIIALSLSEKWGVITDFFRNLFSKL